METRQYVKLGLILGAFVLMGFGAWQVSTQQLTAQYETLLPQESGAQIPPSFPEDQFSELKQQRVEATRATQQSSRLKLFLAGFLIVLGMAVMVVGLIL